MSEQPISSRIQALIGEVDPQRRYQADLTWVYERLVELGITGRPEHTSDVSFLVPSANLAQWSWFTLQVTPGARWIIYRSTPLGEFDDTETYDTTSNAGQWRLTNVDWNSFDKEVIKLFTAMGRLDLLRLAR